MAQGRSYLQRPQRELRACSSRTHLTAALQGPGSAGKQKNTLCATYTHISATFWTAPTYEGSPGKMAIKRKTQAVKTAPHFRKESHFGYSKRFCKTTTPKRNEERSMQDDSKSADDTSSISPCPFDALPTSSKFTK